MRRWQRSLRDLGLLMGALMLLAAPAPPAYAQPAVPAENLVNALIGLDAAPDLDVAALRQQAYNVGGQLDFQLHVMHRWPMMLSVGVARGFQGGGFARTEFMLSLQVL